MILPSHKMLMLGKEDSSIYISELIHPMISCLSDNDSRVRYYACEALFNVVKVARGATMTIFPELFTALSIRADDPDQNVKAASELLDKILKDIVTECPSFDLPGLIPLLRERIYTRTNFARQFVISWVSFLHQVPTLDLIIFLPEFLDGLFTILDDPSSDILSSCETILAEFLTSIKKDPSRVDFAKMANILIIHAQSQHISLQLTAITWIQEFVQLSGKTMLPFTSGILCAILPCMSYENESRKNTREMAKAVSYSLLRLVSKEAVDAAASASNPNSNNVKESVVSTLDTDTVLEVLVACLGSTKVSSSTKVATPTKVAALAWLYHLHRKMPTQVSEKLQESAPILIGALSDPSDEVVRHAITVLASLSGPSCPGGPAFFLRFMKALLQLVHAEKHILEERGPFILRQLCVLLNAEGIYRTLAEILMAEQDLSFARSMVDCLHGILLTSGELAHLRQDLQCLATPNSASLFVCLYETWSHNPVATVSLCLLSQCYQHASVLIKSFGELDITVEFLTEVDKLVQLIESPIFTYLRLQLLDVPQNEALVHSLYGLLMLLPQTDAFHMLRRRLDCVPKTSDTRSPAWKETRADVVKINFDRLTQHFKAVQERHRLHRERQRANSLLNKSVHLDDRQ
ncbi:hypothetical protein B566_EDAN004394 [Ephemera danica]|nr:hypothetical protein B566_EDAN004394 [Ephemera danica]